VPEDDVVSHRLLAEREVRVVGDHAEHMRDVRLFDVRDFVEPVVDAVFVAERPCSAAAARKLAGLVGHRAEHERAERLCGGERLVGGRMRERVYRPRARPRAARASMALCQDR
jgi:hypothetical protein